MQIKVEVVNILKKYVFFPKWVTFTPNLCPKDCMLCLSNVPQSLCDIGKYL